MKILTKYLFKSILQPLFYCLLGFTLLFIINDLFDNFSDFLDSGIQPLEMLYYYGLILPPVAVLILPVCLLLSMLYSLSRLTRHSEITAMRAGGVSIYRIVVPFIGVGIMATLVAGFINEVIAPNTAFRAKQFLDYQRYDRADDIYFAKNIALKRGDHVWMIQKFDTRSHDMYNVEFSRKDPAGDGEIKTLAEKAQWLDGHWWFLDVTVQRYHENGDLAGEPEMILQQEMRELTETPKTFMSEIKDPQHLSSEQLWAYITKQTSLSSYKPDFIENWRLLFSAAKKDITLDDIVEHLTRVSHRSTRHRVDLSSRLAIPFVCLIVTLIGMPVGAHTGRKGALAGIMLALSLFFVFYALQLFAQGFGKLELIPAWLGGWFPTILFGAATPFMIHRMR
jgi:lipopolysaccharide export system permease protein